MNPNNQTNTITAADVPLTLKARYFGSGVAVGVLIAPFVKNAVAKVQPMVGELLETLTGQAEGLVEKSSDLMAVVRDAMGKKDVLDADEPVAARWS